jgi:Uma2 family endonuclease
MSTISPITAESRDAGSPSHRRIPPLQPGDRLTRSEFLRRYAAMPEQAKAERIEGIVYMPAAAVTAEFHGKPHAYVLGWLTNYVVATPGVDVADNSTIELDMDNDPQPDACLMVLPASGGSTKLNAKGYIVGSPELIVEITASSESYDLGTKLNAYRRNGVREYVVWRTYDGEIDWFILRDGEYQRLAQDAEATYKSEAFPGLWLKADAMIRHDLVKVWATLQHGTSSDVHAEFVKRLAEAASARKAV